MKGDPESLQGRRALLHASVVLAFPPLAAMTATGCASRPKEPAPLPPRPVSVLAVLPVLGPEPEQQSSGFGATRPATPIYVPQGQSLSAGSAAGVIGAGLLATAIVAGMQESKRKDREALAAAMAQVNFDAVERIERQLRSGLEQVPVRLVRIEDPYLAARVRQGKLDGLPSDVDGVLDVALSGCGYTTSWRTVGFSPMLEVQVSIVRPPKVEAEELDSFTYYADRRDGGADKRWLTAPGDLTYVSLEKLKAEADSVRSGLEKLVDELVALMVRDIQRNTAGQLRVD